MDLKGTIEHAWNISARGFGEIVRDELLSNKKEAWRDTILSFAPKKEVLNVLDVGCGPGFFSIILANEGHIVTGIDFSMDMVEEARRNAKLCNVSANFLKMDIENPTLYDNSYDLIVSRNVVWTLTNPSLAYKKWNDLLVKNGRVIVFDAGYLKNSKEKFAYDDTYEKEYQEIYGIRPKCSYTKENYEEARGYKKDLPLVGKKRPEFDLNICEDMGYTDVFVKENVNDLVFSDEKDRYLHRNNPYFLVVATK